MGLDYMVNFNAPKECIEGSRIPKKLFYEEYDMSSSDKELFTKAIDKIVLEYMFSEDRINIAAYKNDDIECDEVAVIRVFLHEDSKYKRICEIIQRAIPYSLIVICEYKEKVLFNVANKRINKNDESKNTVEEMVFTDWISVEKQKKNDKVFLEGLNVREWSYSNLYKFYNSFLDKVKLFNASKYSSNLEIFNNIDVDTVKKLTDKIERLELDISSLKDKLKKESQFNKKMDLNIKIKKLEIKKNEFIKELNGNK
ncbi:DUF4391 domain-containing protein [Clostridium sp.]|uniref:DUF4391 domain-containing protein n=1 Tax=Clostridium sp. TaxID=1506 RepID=UPI003521375C